MRTKFKPQAQRRLNCRATTTHSLKDLARGSYLSRETRRGINAAHKSYVGVK